MLTECTCHITQPCGFCVSLDEDEYEAYVSGGYKGLQHLRDSREITAKKPMTLRLKDVPVGVVARRLSLQPGHYFLKEPSQTLVAFYPTDDETKTRLFEIQDDGSTAFDHEPVELTDLDPPSLR